MLSTPFRLILPRQFHREIVDQAKAELPKRMDVGVAYAIWAGAGVALIAIAGMTYFREPIGALKIVSLILVIAGIAVFVVAINLLTDITYAILDPRVSYG